MCLYFQWLLPTFPRAMMFDHVTPEDIDRVMIEGTVCFLFSMLKHTPRPWTFMGAHVNDCSEMGNAGSQEDHDWPEWTSIVGTAQIAHARILIERDLHDAMQYFVVAQDKEEDKEDDDEEISYWSGSDYDWPLDKEEDTLSNEDGFSCNVTGAIHVRGPLKDEDWSIELQTLFKEENEEEGDTT